MKHDCGEHGMLAVKEIAEKCGLSRRTIHDRIARGMTGAELLSPRIDGSKNRKGETYRDAAVRTTGVGAIAMAVKIVRSFPDQVPTVQQLRDKFGMSRSTAYQWRQSFIDEMGDTPK